MNIYIGEPVVVSDMQGPCEVGFHVPLITELTSLRSIGTTLGAWTNTGGTNFSTYLKIPFAKYRSQNDGNIVAGDYGRYWSSNTGSSSQVSSYYYINSSSITSTDLRRGAGCSIRPFKDTPVVPDSNWTVIYQGTGNAGIFHNAIEGIISLSSDGNTWLTISDKNCGATEVWNSGDTLTENNCGKFYQRGNNYGFPRTGNITTSSTTVDATGYGPGNYYESSTFITGGYWDTGYNSNLRGGVSQGTSTKSVEVQNIYIGNTIPVTVAGIYHNPTLGLISMYHSALGWLTIADKNLGATQAWNPGDTLSEANCGKLYQWGNNHGFDWGVSPTNKTTTQVDPTGYGPGNYYDSSTFVYGDAWTTNRSNISNMWGGSTNTNESKKGPCPDGFHIPSSDECSYIRANYGSYLSLSDSQYKTYFKVPPAGDLYWYNGTYQSNYVIFWCANNYGQTTNPYGYYCKGDDGFKLSYNLNSEALPIRPFANEAVPADSSWDVIYQSS